MDYALTIHGKEERVYGWDRKQKSDALEHGETIRLILRDRTCFLKINWILEGYPVEVVHISRTADEARRHTIDKQRKMDAIFGLHDPREPQPPSGGWQPEDFDEVHFSTRHAFPCEVSFQPHNVEEARTVKEQVEQDNDPDAGVEEFAPRSADELYPIYFQEKLEPLGERFMQDAMRDPVKAIREYEETIKIKRRQFFAERIEETFKTLLDQVKKHPRSPKARKALRDAIEHNLKWAKNNLASIEPSDPERGLFERTVELGEQYEKALAEIDAAERHAAPATPQPETLDRIKTTVEAIHAQAARIDHRTAAIHEDTGHLKQAVPDTLNAQAETVRTQADEITKLRAALSARVSDLFAVFIGVERQDMIIFREYIRTGNQVRTAKAAGMSEGNVRRRVGLWPTKSDAYRRLHRLYEAHKKTGGTPTAVSFTEGLHRPAMETPAIDADLLAEMEEVLHDMTPDNLEAKRAFFLDHIMNRLSML